MCRKCGIEGHKQAVCPESTVNLGIEEKGSFIYKGKSYNGIIPFRGEHDILSNLAIVQEGIKYDGSVFKSVEHGYKSNKANAHDREELTSIIENTNSAKDVMHLVDKELQHEEENEEWVLKKQRVMKDLVVAKVKASDDFKTKLIQSKGKLLVEATSHPLYASGLPGVQATLQCPPTEWPGQNKLGIIMMEVRDTLSECMSTANSESQPPSEHPESTSTPIKEQEQVSFNTIAKDIDAAAKAAAIVTPIKDEAKNKEIVSVILGDSILKSKKSPEGCILLAEAGTKLKGISSLVKNAKDTIHHDKIENVVIALGTNDLRENESAGLTIINFQSAVDSMKQEFPNATVYVSAVLPRKDPRKHFTDFNKKTEDINKSLKGYAESDKDKRTQFIANYDSFKPNDINNHYLKSDTSGIHLNREGQNCLLTIIQQSINKISTKKRQRSSATTPSSAEKDAKTRKCASPIS